MYSASNKLFYNKARPSPIYKLSGLKKLPDGSKLFGQMSLKNSKYSILRDLKLVISQSDVGNKHKTENMKHFKQIIRGLIITMMLLSCNSKDKIIGEWERYGDIESGTLINIEKFGDSYQGSIMNLVGDNEMFGWQIGDICWKNISLVETNKYKAIGVLKGFENYQSIIRESEIILVIVNENTLLVKDFVTNKKIIGEGKERRYKRVK